jgi:peptidyl-prolyl cis-trans isomerase B (cyclophilin B)
MLFLTLPFISCSDNDLDSKNRQETKKEKRTSFEDIKPKENLPMRLSNTNCVDYLVHYGEENQETIIKILTKFGDIKIRLYKDTPLHRANFIQLIKKGIYANTQFSRVVKGFVIQGGSSNETLAADKKFYLGEYMLPSEMSIKHIHKYGALAMSRKYNGNPDKLSDAFDFYIVIGEKIGDRTLYQIQKEKGITYTEEQLHLYNTIGGTPHLDFEHTVFGEVISGMQVVNKINKVDVDAFDWPNEDIVINLEVIR